MAILAIHTAAGMDTATYDQVAPGLTAQLKKQPGFMFHAAYMTPEGLQVGEIWEKREQHEKWFNESVKPNVPAEIKVDVIELHNVATP